MDVIQIEALFDDDLRPCCDAATRSAIADAEVVIAVDKVNQREFTVFGTPALEETVRFGKQVALPTVRIEFQGKPDRLEQIMSFVQAVKRGQDQLASDE